VANLLYSKAKEALLNGDIHFETDQIKILFVDSTYSPSISSDEFVSNIPSSSIKHRSNPLVNVTTDLGVLDADDIAIPDYPGNAFKALVLYKNTGTDATSRIIAYIEDSVGLPFSGSSSQFPISIIWNNDNNKIIALTNS